MHLSIKYAMQYIKRNTPTFISTVIMTSITVVLLNFFLFLAYSAYQLGVYLQKQQKVSVLFEPLTPTEEIKKLVEEIKIYPAVANIEVTDSARLEDESLKQLGVDPKTFKRTQQSKENIIPIIRIHLKPDVSHKDLIYALKQEEASNPKVIQIIYFEKLVERINKITRAIKITGATTLGLLALITIYLIHMSIKMSIYQAREEIHTMKLLGAKSKLIVLPFAIQGGIVGIIGTIGGIMFIILLMLPLLFDSYTKLIARIFLQILPPITYKDLLFYSATEILTIALFTFIISYATAKKFILHIKEH